jgi:hypothetical protein
MTLTLPCFEGSYVAPLLSPGRHQTSSAPYAATALYELQDFAPVENNTTARPIGEAPGEPKPVTRPSVTHIHGRRDRVKARFRMLRRLPNDHDHKGLRDPILRALTQRLHLLIAS